MRVMNNTVVSIRYRMENCNGEELENIMENEPVQYIHGAGDIMPALEAGLTGLNEGEKKSIFLTKKDGFAGLDDDFYIEVVVDGVRTATEDELIRGLQKPGKEDCCGSGCC